MKFNRIIKSVIMNSGDSIDKTDIEKIIESINQSLIFSPYNYWLGVRILKNPLDLMLLQEIIFEKRPDTIIECGTAYGGSAYYIASLMDLMKINGKIISIDNQEYPMHPYPKTDLIKTDGKITRVDGNLYQSPIHSKIHYIQSDCLSVNIPKTRGKTMLILDCDHSANHVEKELEKFSSLVSIGQYIIIEDTGANEEEGGGPAKAVKNFLKRNRDFIIDKSREKYGITSNPGGYLLRVS